MATLILGAAGAAIGSAVGGTILGVSATAIGYAVGTALGSAVDGALFAPTPPSVEGPRVDSLPITGASEGTVLPRAWGRRRLGGTLIYAEDFREKKKTSGGGKGFGSSGPKVSSYSYSTSVAVAICEGEIGGIGRVWADGEEMDLRGVTWRWYPGSETQDRDPYLAERLGTDNTPAYLGTAYVVFEGLKLEKFGNRVPQFNFEVLAPRAEPDTAEGQVRAVAMIPGTGEFALATTPVTSVTTESLDLPSGWGENFPSVSKSLAKQNQTASEDVTDFVASLDRLEAMCPAVESVSLVVCWFGDDLRAGHCTVRPKVVHADKQTEPKSWTVNGVKRNEASEVTSSDTTEGTSNETSGLSYGGTPADFSVIEAIRELKSRGYRVTLYPMLLMDVPAGNSLPDPYSDNAATTGQPAHPWRGRITCSPAPGYAGSVDKTGTAAGQVANFFGLATPADFGQSGEKVFWDGASGEWGLRRMVLHYAHLCQVAGGVDSFLIGTEMRALTRVRSGPATYPAVLEFRTLLADVRAIMGATTQLGYAADWSEYFGHQPGDGSGDVFFHLDPLWADPESDFIGIDNYMPLADWRDGFDHLDARAGWSDTRQHAYLAANVAGGEGYDWYYASAQDREAQIRSPITDGAYGKHWIFRYKDLANWWANPHHDRPGGIEAATPTAWVPQSKPIRFTEVGCPAVDRGANQPNVFSDAKSSEDALPYFSRGGRDDAMQRAYLEAMFGHYGDPAYNPVSTVYSAPMIDLAECAVWAWDGRPFPWFPARTDVWSDGPNWNTGHWITGRLGAVSLRTLVRDICRDAGLSDARIDVSGLWGQVDGYTLDRISSARAAIAPIARLFGFDAVESGGVIRFFMRSQAPAVALGMDDLVGSNGADDNAFELVRGQETEMPARLKWAVHHAGEEYDSAQVEAVWPLTGASGTRTESFPVAAPPEEAERQAMRALAEAWAGIDRGSLRLPPSRLALDAGDVISLLHDGRSRSLRLVTVEDARARTLEVVRYDRAAYDIPPRHARSTKLAGAAPLSRPAVVFLDLPWLSESHTPHRPFLAAHAAPWPGALGVYRTGATPDGYSLLQTLDASCDLGQLTTDFPPGPVGLWDDVSAL